MGDADLLRCSSRHAMTSVQVCVPTCCESLKMPSFTKTMLGGIIRICSPMITHLEVPVHNVMLVDMTDALQDLIDAVAKGDRER